MSYIDFTLNTFNSEGIQFITSKRELDDPDLYHYIDIDAKEYVIEELDVLFTVRFLNVRHL